MKNSKADAYAAAGVDITAGYEAVRLMKEHVARTVTDGVISEVGGFGGLFRPELYGIKDPVLVSGTDGVGTKLKLAFLADRHDTVGIDCVAMCVNDIVCCGAAPMFFLDYIACGKNVPEKIAQLVKGVAEGCVQAGCALIGGETAEMPGFYPEDEYDLAGFAVGLADGSRLPDKNSIKPGDTVIALASSGVHSNGFSLVRKVLEVETADLNVPVAELSGKSLGEVLLTPTKIYVKPMLALFKEANVKAVSHITGGGFFENIPRSLPEGIGVKIRTEDVRVLPVFEYIAARGGISQREMFNTFNMGVGMTVIVSPEEAGRALEILKGKRRRGIYSRRNCQLRRGDYIMVKTKIAVFISGGGTNLQALIDAQRDGILRNGRITLVISSNSIAYGLKRAKEAGIDAVAVTRRECGSQEAFEAEILEKLEEYGIELIVLAGFLNILSEDFVKRYSDRIINIHPSLIPSFCGKGYYGIRVHEAALDYGVKVTGATVHFVNEIPDGGRIIRQKAVKRQKRRYA